MKNIALKQQLSNWDELDACGTSILRGLSRYVFILLSFLFIIYTISSFFNRPILEVNYSQITKAINYGPLPLVDTSLFSENSYNFFSVEKSFKGLDLTRINEVNKDEFRKLVLKTLPNKKLRYRLAKYLSHTLKMAEKYNVDPFWVLSIMWTESHFNQYAKSYVNASGLMQVMPGTAFHLLQLMKRPVPYKTAVKLSHTPHMNIEMGVFYLRRLLRKFNGNYKLATVSYNMGPTGVRRRLRRGLPVGVKNQYLDKVRAAHKKISSTYKNDILIRKKIYKSTYVAKRFQKISMKMKVSQMLDFSHIDDALRVSPVPKYFQKIVFL